MRTGEGIELIVGFMGLNRGKKELSNGIRVSFSAARLSDSDAGLVKPNPIRILSSARNQFIDFYGKINSFKPYFPSA